LDTSALRKTWLQWIGLGMPPLAWALSTQLGQITPYIDCRQNIPWSAALSGVLLVVSVAGLAAARAASPGTAQTKRFIVDAGFLVGLAFVFALSLQEAATMLLDACQR
jgi:hypothetical protein